ncbi:protein of unknown function [Citrobacter freundii]|nr:protein of unknown function [Citrobacter freundii]
MSGNAPKTGFNYRLRQLYLDESDYSPLHSSYSATNSVIIAIALLIYCEFTHILKAVTSRCVIS